MNTFKKLLTLLGRGFGWSLLASVPCVIAYNIGYVLWRGEVPDAEYVLNSYFSMADAFWVSYFYYRWYKE